MSMITLHHFEQAVAVFEDGATVSLVRTATVEIGLRRLRFWQIRRRILIRRMCVVLDRLRPAGVQFIISYQ